MSEYKNLIYDNDKGLDYYKEEYCSHLNEIFYIFNIED